MIVFDASAVVSAALREDSVPERTLLRAEAADLFALAVGRGGRGDRRGARQAALCPGRHGRTPDAHSRRPARRRRVVCPNRGVTDCRDAKDNKYLELAPAAGTGTIVSGDADLLVLDPWRGVRILKPAAYLAEAEGGQ